MKVLIQDSASRLYLGHSGQWTDFAIEAKDFSFTAHARAVARNLNLKSYRVLFYFADIDYRIVVCDSDEAANMAAA